MSIRRGWPKGRSRPRRLSPVEWAVNLLLYRYKDNARRFDRAFTLNRAEFSTLITSPCFYCGTPPRNTVSNGNKNDSRYFKDITYNGIDRLDNNIGYIPGNCVPCCKDCNIAKGKKHWIDFMVWIERLAAYQQRSVAHA